MALSVEKLLTDAHTLIVRLKDHDNLTDNMISTTQVLFNKFEAMKQVWLMQLLPLMLILLFLLLTLTSLLKLFLLELMRGLLLNNYLTSR